MLEPNSVDVAVGHIVQIIASVSSNTYGGCSIPYLDRALVRYIKKTFKKHFLRGAKYIDDLKEEEIEELKKEDLEYSNQFIKNKYPKTYEYSS